VSFVLYPVEFGKTRFTSLSGSFKEQATAANELDDCNNTNKKPAKKLIVKTTFLFISDFGKDTPAFRHG